MAKGRLLNKKISLNNKVNSLSCDTSRLLFTWIIAHLDQHGCYYGEAKTVKSLVFPLRDDLKISKIEKFLSEFESLGLIIRYDIDGVKYLFYPKFVENQPNLRADREAESDIPAYQNDRVDPECVRSKSGKGPAEEEEKNNRRLIEEEEEGEKKEEGEKASAATASEQSGLIFTTYEKNVGMITPAISDRMKVLITEFPAEWIIEAIEKATRAEKRSLGYAEGILRGWKREGKNGPEKPFKPPNRGQKSGLKEAPNYLLEGLE